MLAHLTYSQTALNRRMRTRMYGGVAGESWVTTPPMPIRNSLVPI